MTGPPESAKNNIGIIYGLEDRPPFLQAALTAFQHLMSMVISIGAPPLIICQALNLPAKDTAYLVNMAFFISGIGTFIQTRRFGPVGSGLLNIQATSFIFPTAFTVMGAALLKEGYSPEKVVAFMSGATLAGSLIQIILSRMTRLLNKVFTPMVCGVTVTMVGISLIEVAMKNFLGGDPSSSDYASLANVGLGSLVLGTIVLFNTFKNPFLRMSAMIMGFAVGLIVAAFLGLLHNPFNDATIFNLPVPFKYGLDFTPTGFITIALLYVIVTVEVTGDLSATCMLSREATSGPRFVCRLSGGILGGGVSSFIAGIFNSFPTAIFAQNSGVIQLTGNASRHVGKYVAVYLIILGCLPIIGRAFQAVPPAVLGGALLLLFGIITTTGMRIIFSEAITRRGILILSLSLGVGVGSAFAPELIKNFPNWLADILHSPVAACGLVAIIANIVLPNYHEGADEPAAH